MRPRSNAPPETSITGNIRLFLSLAALGDRIARFRPCHHSAVERYATLFFGALDSSGRLEYINAGHLPPFLVRDGKTEAVFSSESLPIGLFEYATFKTSHAQLEPGDTLVLYTDGLTEAENQQGDFFGEERLMTLFAEYHRLTPQQIIDNLLRQARLFAGVHHFNDDVSLVVMQVKADESEAAK